jgi:hypothetical protein
MRPIIRIAKASLVVWGGLCFIGALAVAGFAIYRFSVGNRDEVDLASSRDVRFVLNWCELGDKRIEKVLHSYVSSRSLTGDHLDAYAIKITHVAVEELAASKDRCYRGDELPKIVDDAVAFVGSWLGSDKIPWFPKEKELRSHEFYVYPWSIYCHGVRPTAVELIFIRPSDKMVFFFSGKT